MVGGECRGRGKKHWKIIKKKVQNDQAGEGPQDHIGQTARRNKLINAAIVRTGVPDEDETAVAVSRHRPPAAADSCKLYINDQLPSALEPPK